MFDSIEELKDARNECKSTANRTLAAMALLNQCFCCSLLTGAVLTGVYSAAVYIVAFALEVWIVTDAKDSIPTPCYILCAGYLMLWIVSVAFLVGLALRRTKPILAWMLFIVVMFFPECGLVLFMSLYHWTLESTIGTGELIFWIVRAFLNIFGLCCVFSLYACWREEENVNRRLRDLTMASPMSNGFYNNSHIKTPLPGSLRAGYHNAAYLASEANLQRMASSGNSSSQRNRFERMSSIQRSTSSLSSVSLKSGYGQRRLNLGFGNLHEFDAVLHKYQQKHQTAPGLAYGSMGIAGVGLDPEEPVLTNGRFRTQSLLYIDDVDQYWNRPPLSRPVSTALILNPRYSDFATPTFDRQSQFVFGPVDTSTMRRAHSMNDLNFRFPAVMPDVTLQKLDRKPFSYLPKPNSRNSLGAESDDLHHYKDVAL